MMEKYILVYPASDDWQQVSWCVHASEQPSSCAQGDLSTLAEQALDLPIVAIIPGIWLSMFKAALPKGRSAQIKKAIPFLLEEQLAEDLEEVHFALPATYQLGETTPIAVINQNRMRTLVATFKEKHLNLQYALPDWLCLPLFEQTWTIYLGQTHVCVRQAKDLGFSIQKNLLMPMLNLALNQAEQKPHTLHVYHLAMEAADMEEQLTTLNIPLAYEAVNMDPLLLWAQHIEMPPALNLLQGEYYIRPKFSKVKRLWMMAGGMVAAIIMVQLLHSSVEYQQYKNQYDALHAQVLELYTSVFPGETQTGNARARLEPMLAESGSSANNPLFIYLQDISDPLLNIPDVVVQQLSLQENSLQLEVVVKDFAALGQLEAALAEKGLTVKQDSASLENDQVIAQLHVTRGK